MAKDVAAPYTRGAAKVFVPSRVVRVQELKGKKISRYGVAYIKGAQQ